jgi:hypothetical protein
MDAARRFATFREFYPFYLTEHANATSRRLHVIGTSMTLLVLLYALGTGSWWLVLLSPVPGYACAWIGHFFFEHNRPATFQHPFYSLAGDFVMLRDVLTGRIRW